MRVLLDFTSAIGDRTGVGTYTRLLTRALLARRAGESLGLALHVFRHSGWRRTVARRLHGPPAAWHTVPNRLIPPRVVFEANRLLGMPSVETLFEACDVFHGTNFLAPPGRRCRTVVTVHDLAFVRFEKEIAVPHRYRRYIGSAIERADRVIAVSRATADDIRSIFGPPPGKVVVVHEGVPRELRGLGESEFLQAKKRLGIPDRFFLFVGTLEPRKNLLRLVRAYRTVAEGMGRPPGLVLVGRTGWSCREILGTISEASRNLPVLRLGFVPEPLRNSLYEHCLALILPSVYEGFGLPLLEAFVSGAPAVCSTGGALPEVAGDAALLFDPEDERGLADALLRITAEESLRADLSARGRRRAAAFSWTRAAEETREVYEHA